MCASPFLNELIKANQRTNSTLFSIIIDLGVQRLLLQWFDRGIEKKTETSSQK